MTTVHANTPRDVISRLEVMVTQGGGNMPLSAIRQQIAAAVDMVVQVARMSDGSRRVTGAATPKAATQDTRIRPEYVALRPRPCCRYCASTNSIAK